MTAVEKVQRRLVLAARRSAAAARVAALERRVDVPPQPDDTKNKYSILFVCHGNICRSPMAEGIMRQRLRRASLLGQVDVASAGTSGANEGRRPDPRARLVMLRHGATIRDLRARELAAADLNRFDLILTMDAENQAAVLRAAENVEQRSRVRLLTDGAGGVIGDPVAGRLSDFERAYEAIDRACEALVEQVETELSTSIRK